ncbi:FtsX-like permease family protein [Roseburia sp. 499]|uniref:FtsX-like permease family protein n=1 Tax=Roseburia sp. 499 TaxID=1261634 RepID=UPI0009522507|nr:FtsX-like permease family protein [Roseburia sp. 499]WVK69380.1 FtsX-like permease family protein [Roseburia sp. 499]
MKKAFRKNIFRTIKKSLGRYMAIFAIIALGVGFFAGLKTTKPAMLKTGQEYIREQKMYDYRFLSTWGFEEEEISGIANLDGIEKAEGAYWEDFIYLNEAGEESCLKALSITTQVNQLIVTAGRMPERAEECVVDAYYYSGDMIGKKIAISSENSLDIKDSFAYDTYTVTGLVRSPLYMNSERGTTTIGNGKIDAFVFIPQEGFSFDYYKEVYACGDMKNVAFTDEYQKEIDDHTDTVEQGVTSVIEARYVKEIAEAKEEIADARQELAEKTAEAQQELLDAKSELEEGEAALTQGKQELQEAKNTLAEKEQELREGEVALAEGENALAKAEQELTEGEAALAEGEVQYQKGLAEYQAGLAAYQQGLAGLERSRSQYEQAKSQKEQLELAGLGDALNQNEMYLALKQAVEEFEANELQLRETKVQLDVANAQLIESRAKLDASQSQLAAGRQQLEANHEKLTGSRVQIADGKSQIENGKNEIIQAEQEIAENEKTLADGWKEYEDGVTELENETTKAEQKIADAEEELAAVEEPKAYILNRSMNVGYASFEGDVNIVEAVAKVFPVFFFLIAALVCSTTMTRMVDDERTQIGTLRALGYTEGAILSKYIIYSGSAAGIGTAIGYFLGSRLFPMAIWIAYGMLYGFTDTVITVDNVWLFLLSLLVALLCSVGTTFMACRLELAHTPADLIRPKAPSAGKRILLEKISIVWKHLKFLHKVSARNIFRFKKRMIMMILGIAGCTSLVIAGFGVKDSVSNIVNNQYDEILQYDISATYTKAITKAVLEEIEEQFGKAITGSAVLQEASADAPYENGSKTVTLLVSEDAKINQCVNFHLDEKSVELPKKGEILIDNRLAEVLSLKIGDEVTLQVGEKNTKPLKVAGIFENYAYYYAYVTAETYEEYFGEIFEPKTIYFALEEGADAYQIASYLSDMKNASNMTIIEDMKLRVQNMMESMNYIVVLIICCAAALAFIVLFNLGNINISERVREIATLKVLGFYPRETGAYVFRENMVLSIMGIIFGVPLGKLLHRFVMLQIKIDMVSFEINIRPQSYLYSVIAVLGFTLCVDIIMRRKINRINMAESLKSIE